MEAKTEIFVSSPGKVILFGEHAVVYDKPALAASLDLCTFVDVKDSVDACVHLNLLDLNQTAQWTTKQIAESLAGFMGKDVHNVAVLSVEDVQRLRSDAEQIVETDNSAVIVFLYFYSSIVGSNGNKLLPMDVHVRSCIPIGSGLGSSASYTSSLSAAMLRAVKAISEKEFSAADLQLVNQWAFSAEHILHGKPSGVDNAVSVFGGLISFKSGVITPLKCSIILEILLIDTKVKRETKKLVDKVRKRNVQWPTVIQPVLEAIGGVTDTVQSILTSLDATAINFDELNTLIDMNQGLLSTLGVSHPSLDEICQIAKQHGYSAKLTGAGGGGCAFCLIPSRSSGLDDFKIELESKDFSCLRVKVGGSGLQLYQNVEEFNNEKSKIVRSSCLEDK